MTAEVEAFHRPAFATFRLVSVDMQGIEVFADIVEGLQLRTDGRPDVGLNAYVQEPGAEPSTG